MLMSESESAAGHRGDRTDAAAHPDQALDALEERVFGRRMDQVRDDDQPDDDTDPASIERDPDQQTEPP